MNKKPRNRNSIFIRTLSTVACSIILAHLAFLMRTYFCVWCVKCAKYLAFDTFERPDDSALIMFLTKGLSLVFNTSPSNPKIIHKH